MTEKGPAVVGVGRTKFGEHYERDPEHLVEEAGLVALRSVDVEREDLDACFFADYFLPITNKIGLEEGFLSELLELNIPMEITRSFSSALSNACNAVQAGKYSLVLVGGMEKMTDRWDKIRDDLMLLEDPWSYYAGGTPESNHELMLRSYMKTHRLHDNERNLLMLTLAELSVRNHENALKNEFAQFQRKISVDMVLGSRRKLRRPLGLYDFAPVSDGASALILSDSDSANSYTQKPVSILGYSLATDYITFPSRRDLTGFLSSRLAMKGALEASSVGLNDISVLQIYDQSTFVGLVTLEDLGFYGKGEAWKSVQENYISSEGCYEINGEKLFINVNGGLKADGNPLGATGGAQVFEVFKQLRREAGERQIKADALKNGCVHELEGFGTKAYVFLLGMD
ncbi:thiolase family protein [Candidatus Bathyarchaeota archaeon]|nr:thiolase family protein [Candidatus Bathyarchaeota archaeon]MCK5630958.1 thiolase family protein [Candidatus Bathyarchaeota archaeon]